MKDVAIVGLPFSGKSTVFAAVARSHGTAGAGSQRANIATVAVPDPRVDELTRLHGSERAVYSQVRLSDVPGLDARALAAAREADALAVVLRAFGPDADPLRDLASFRAELAVADLQTMEKVVDRARRQARTGQAAAVRERDVMERAERVLSADRWLAEETWEPEDRRVLQMVTPLTLKPVLHVVNVEEDVLEEAGPSVPDPFVLIRGLVEAEAAELDPAEAAELLAEFGVTESATARFVRSVYALLDLVTFYTAGPKESRAWEVRRGAKAPEAAGTIHTDMERGFIRCEVESYDDLVAAGTWEAARDKGLMRLEGKEYEIRDADVVHIRHSG